MTSEAAAHFQALRDRLAKARALKQVIRDTTDRLSRDDAIIAYTRTLDLLIEDLIVLEDLGLMTACADHLSASESRRDTPPG